MTRRGSTGASVRTPPPGRKAASPPRPEPKPVPGRDWIVIALGGLWLVVLALWVRGVLRSASSVVYLLALAMVAVYVARAVQVTSDGDDGWRTGRKALVLGLLVTVPVLFDWTAPDLFNVARYAVVVVGAFALVGLWAIGAVHHRRPPWWRNGLRWPVLALVGWTALTTATSVNPRFSALGAYESYDGLYATLAFAALLFVTADTFRLADLKSALRVLYLGGGGLVMLYGLVQLHDVVLGGRDWDWIKWPGGLTAISANLGNPNHLGAFLAVLFPIGLALLAMSQSPWIRALIGVMGAVIVAELVHTASRGAWLATVVASVSLVLLLATEARRRPGLFAAVAVGYVAVAVVSALTLGTSGSLQRKLNPDELSANEATSANQRVEMWRAAVRMANDRPLVGVGPDAFGPRFYAYQSAAFAERYGTRLFANGAHNVFFNRLATQGYPGLAALVALMGSATALGVTTWRLLRRHEGHGGGPRMRPEDDAELRRRAREGRLAVAGIGSALLAYVVQASFNVQKISLSFLFWALLGLLCVAARSVEATIGGLRRRPGGAVEPESPPADWASLRAGLDARGRGRVSRAESPPPTEQAFVFGIGALVIVGLVAVGTRAAGPWQAERAYGEALRAQNEMVSESQRNAQPSSPLRERMFRQLRTAQVLNPWEPRYVMSDALGAVRQASGAPAGSQLQRELLARADAAYRRVIRTEPGGPRFLLLYGDALLRLHERHPGVVEARERALEALRQAHRVSPRDPDIAARLSAAERS